MSLLDHLRELRRRATISAIAVLVASVGGFIVSDVIIAAASGPLEDLGNAASGLNFTTVGSAFELRFRVALTVGVVASSPIWIYQFWAFLVPGLTGREKKYTVAFVGAAAPLFLAGAAFGWWILPNIVALLLSFAPADSSSYLNAEQYFDFLLRLVIAVGFGFVSPLALVALNAAGVLRASSILRAWRQAVVVIIIFSATVTPASDVLSMFLIAGPLIALFFAAYGWAAIHDRRVDRAREREQIAL